MLAMQEKSGLKESHQTDLKMQEDILSTMKDLNVEKSSQTTMMNEATNSIINTTSSSTVANMPISASAETTSNATNSSTDKKTVPNSVVEQPALHTNTPQTVPTRSTKRTANDYRFGKTIGEGSFSTVYLAKDIHTNKEVASKSNSTTNLFCVESQINKTKTKLPEKKSKQKI